MRKLIFFIGLLAWSFCHSSTQSRLKFIVDKEGKLYAVPTKITYAMHVPENTYKSYIPVTERYRRLSERYTDIYRKYTDMAKQSIAFSFLPPSEADRPMNMNTLSAAYRPFFNPYAPMLRRLSPFAFDYDEYATYPLGDNTLFWINGTQFTWPGLGGVNVVEASISQHFGALTLSGSTFGGRFFTPYTPNAALFGGFSLSAHYQITDWMALKAWGSYAFYGKDLFFGGEHNRLVADPFMTLNPALNRTSVGGAMEFKLGDHGGFGIGVNFEYDHFRGKMRPQYIFYPAHTGSFFDKIGFQVGGN